MTIRDLTPWRRGPNRHRGLGAHDPFLPMLEPMERLFEEIFGRVDWQGGDGRMAPRIDVTETETEYRFAVELPGVKTENLDVMVADGMLAIKGEKKFEHKEEKSHVLMTERRQGLFERTLTLPIDADEEKVEARFEDGVLTLTVGKKEETTPAKRRIEIKTH